MKHFVAVFFLVVVFSYGSYGQRVVIIGLDGFSVEGYKKAHHPNIDKLMGNGILSLTTRSVMPSVTLPNWTSHVTGSGPEQHGVVSNDWTLEEHTLPPLESDDEGYYPSVFKVLKDHVPYMKTAYYYNWGNLINPINRKYLDEVSFLEEDRYVENYEKAFDFIKANKENPTLVFLYSVHTDHAGHKHKWMSPEYINAIEEADVEIGHLMDKMKKEGLFENTHFILITDHGGIGNGHGGVTENEMLVPWGIVGPRIVKGKVFTGPNTNLNTSLLICNIFDCADIPESWVGWIPRGIFVK